MDIRDRDMLTEIKGKLERLEWHETELQKAHEIVARMRDGTHKQKLDDDLVEELKWLDIVEKMMKKNIDDPEAEWMYEDLEIVQSIRKLLQSKLPEKPRISKGEIERWVSKIKHSFNPEDTLEYELKSKGFKVGTK